MRIRACAITLLFAPVSIGWGADAAMSAEERAHVLKLLEDSRAEFLAYVENVSEAQWTWKAGPERWSVGETAEHILLAEGGLFGRMQQALVSDPNPDWEKKTAGKTEFLERVMVDRSHKAVAPEAIRPQGLSKDDVLRRFKEARAKTIAFAMETQAALKEHTSEHPFPVFNTLNAYQWLLDIPLHSPRHDQQNAPGEASPAERH